MLKQFVHRHKKRQSFKQREERQKRIIIVFMVLFSFVCIIIGELLLLRGIATQNEKKIAEKKLEYFRSLPAGSDSKQFYDFLKKNKEYEQQYQLLLKESKRFPLKKEELDQITYVDSWGGERNYGGKRRHEGCDLMSETNKRGELPIFSMSDGVLENKGWLTLGGYRLGIKTESGIYYYYAHLYSYADGLKVGDKIKAGQFLGFMGDSGYGEEGTTGQFPVHLHLGIYFKNEKEELSINPYWILKEVEERERSKIAP